MKLVSSCGTLSVITKLAFNVKFNIQIVFKSSFATVSMSKLYSTFIQA